MARNSNSLSLQILTTFLILLSCPQISMCLKVETQALLEFKKQLIDPLNYLESWKDSDSDSNSDSYSDSPCHFYGVVCDQETQLVTEISLENKSLSGIISPSIYVLRNLSSLFLPSNQITGKIPNELRNCVNLRTLNVSDNYMNGTVPDFSSLIKLETLDLSNNYFSGPFPGWVGNLTGLVSLSLGYNDYDEGEIPETLGNLKNLSFLFLAASGLKGQIPESIFELEKLGTLDMCKNKISGEFPPSIVKLKNLFKIELYQNNLTGKIPDGLADLTHLQEIDISANQLFGEIPKRIGDLKKLTVFQIFNNNFSGEIPAGFGDMEHLIGFSVYMNNFSGVFPQNLGRFSPLSSIDISENQFSGPFPRFLCHNGNLIILLALKNKFSGGFPDSYADCTPLKRMRVSNNKLTGLIPDKVWALPNVDVMDFTENDFSGPISPAVGASSQLNQLLLSNNRFYGQLPKELGELKKLERIYLNNNNFSGKIPIELGALKQIASIHLESNALIGSIPTQLADCPRMVDLNLASNFLSGDIPSSFSRMTSLNSLNLSGNGLTGPIPTGFEKLRLSLVDFSNNRLSGRVPPYFLNVADDKALFGNKNLCVDENESNKRFVKFGVGFCEGRNGRKKFMKSKMVIFCMLLFVLVVLLVSLLLLSYRNFRKQKNDVGGEKGNNNSLNWKLESFQKNEFDPDEICVVDDDNLIGSGSTGKVYRVDLKKGCGTVAVKQLWKGSGVKIMEAEMEIMGKIRHKNILKLYACLTRGGSNVLVFEYMSNGNLFDAIHREIKFGKTELDWCQRYKIAVGSAKGIAYLHHDCNPAIIHRDIKSTNILLDDEYEAKIADFGVAKVADGVSPGGSEMSCFAGTHGYIAPEMAYSLKLTEKSDVYSFGVVLMELVTGKRPVEEEYGEGRDIVYHVSTHLDSRENMLKLLDRKVVSELVKDDMIKVLKTATLCTTKLPNLRPTMKEVVKMLIDAEPIVLKFADGFGKK
ncbi:hypothetical protein CASFOL_016411 [Castilleja foliolosa]|uniref:non-specific serine/threonine protein kinase n=1 Tax=Castilleja foliolosa TaxID=1961234 RepID=A0ABD3DGJ3_9LAMI